MRWRFWSGRRDRLALALLGVFVLGSGLSVMSLLTDSVTGTVTKTYEQTWRAPYDILVHVPLADAASLPDVTEPNALTTLPPGITLKQLEGVRETDGVTLAAPLAVVGYVGVGPKFAFPREWSTVLSDPSEPSLQDLDPGVYRLTSTVTASGAATPQQITYYDVVGVSNRKGGPPSWAPSDLWVLDSKQYANFDVSAPTLVVGVGPDAEAKLTGLPEALTSGRYFEPTDSVSAVDPTEAFLDVPVLMNQQAFEGLTFEASVARVGQDGGPQEVVYRRTVGSAEFAQTIGEMQKARAARPMYRLLGYAAPLAYQQTQSPQPHRWPFAATLPAAPSAEFVARLQADYPLPGRQVAAAVGETVRPFISSPPPMQEGAKTLFFDLLGFFDTSKLDVVKNPDSQLPLMTYRPAEGLQVLDASGHPVNPPRLVTGGMNPAGFLSSPPIFLTTLDAALKINGDGAINAIQVKVQGSEHFTPETVAHVRQVAEEIEKRTGLVAEVVMGSSPMNVLVHVPASNGHPDLGWFQEQWIHKDAAITTVQQAEFGYSAFIVMVLAVAVLYAAATGLAGVTARRRELGVATALGWPGGSLRSIAVGEQALFALAAGLLAALAAVYGEAPPLTVGLVLLASLLVYLPAVVATGYTVSRVSPGDALRWGDTALGRRVLPGSGIMPLAASSLMGRPGRTALTVLAIALPTALVLMLAYITQHLNGVLYTTVTGQYAALKVGPVQYLIGLVGLALATVTALDLIHQNAMDHRSERALLHALGWPRNWIARTMIAEGGLLGLAAGLLGDVLGLLVLAGLYGSAVVNAWQTALMIWLLPLGLGLLMGALTSLMELRSWNRTAMAGVGASQVARMGRWTMLAAVAAVVLVVVVVGVPLVSQTVKRVQQQAQSAEEAAAQQAIQAIHAAVDEQSVSLNSLNIDAFLATLDPAEEASPYRMEQRHWLENATVWKQSHPRGRLSRTVQEVSLLGTNTANVRLWQTADTDDPTDPNSKQVQSLNTVWVKTADGRWVEHGLQHEVLNQGGVTVWYSGNVSLTEAQESAKNVGQAVDSFRKTLGWTVELPIIVEMADDPRQMRAAIGPHLATKEGIPPWVEYGEPLRVAENGPLSLNSAYYDLAYKSVMDQSHNHAAEWLREALARYALHRLAGVPLDSAVRELRASGPMTLGDIPRSTGFLDLPDADFRRAAATAELFIVFLEQRYGSRVTTDILSELARQPADLRMTGPATYDERSQASIAAIEKATGRSWQQLDEAYQAWFSQLP